MVKPGCIEGLFDILTMPPTLATQSK